MSACGALPMPNGAVIMTPFRSPIWDSNPNVIGSFVGTDVTSTWACPKGHWFPADICDSATRVISGVQTFIQPGRGELFSVNAEYVVTDDGTLWNYWPDLIPCLSLVSNLWAGADLASGVHIQARVIRVLGPSDTG